MRILILGNSKIFQRKVYPALCKIKKLKIELASKRIIKNNIKLDKFYNSYQLAIKKTKAKIVYISLVNSLHFFWALESLKNDMHVIIDKPITLSFKHTKKLLDLAIEKKLLLSEAIVFDKNTCFEKMCAKINLKNKTKIFCKFHIPKLDKENFRNYKKYGGGCFNDMSPYASSLINIFFKKKKYSLQFYKKKNQAGIIDSFEIIVVAKNIYLEASFSFNSIYKNEIQIHNQKKRYFINYAFSPPIDKTLELIIFDETLKKRFNTSFPKQNVFYTYFNDIFKILRKKNNNYSYKELAAIAEIKKKIS